MLLSTKPTVPIFLFGRFPLFASTNIVFHEQNNQIIDAFSNFEPDELTICYPVSESHSLKLFVSKFEMLSLFQHEHQLDLSTIFTFVHNIRKIKIIAFSHSVTARDLCALRTVR